MIAHAGVDSVVGQHCADHAGQSFATVEYFVESLVPQTTARYVSCTPSQHTHWRHTLQCVEYTIYTTQKYNGLKVSWL